MSYVLDALKKAEAENDPTLRASLALDERKRHRYRGLLQIAAAALVINAVVVVWLVAPKFEDLWSPASPEAAPSVGNVPPAAIPDTLTSGQPAPSPPEQAASRGAETAVAAPVTTGAQPSSRVPAPPPPATRVAPRMLSIDQLPPATRSRFPDLNFSTHVYADDPSLRAIVVNGERLTEGGRLGDLELQQITEEGAVFRFETYLVSISVLESWE